MKKLITVVAILVFGLQTFAQSTETGYVTVTWTEVEPCCIGMKYHVCITVMRVSDRVVVQENLCETINLGNDQYTFEFEFPCSYSSEEFQVFATVRAGCDSTPPVLCHFGKNPGTPLTDCEELMSGDFTIVGDYEN
ncbi:MAG: hypothetical protein RBS55_03745 [Bacteroidales bacterium]|jgi:hypothetical protein|nr:hypothetical protein [Bacteroidales bacterium]